MWKENRKKIMETSISRMTRVENKIMRTRKKAKRRKNKKIREMK
jgi:hypothetical protein